MGRIVGLVLGLVLACLLGVSNAAGAEPGSAGAGCLHLFIPAQSHACCSRDRQGRGSFSGDPCVRSALACCHKDSRPCSADQTWLGEGLVEPQPGRGEGGAATGAQGRLGLQEQGRCGSGRRAGASPCGCRDRGTATACRFTGVGCLGVESSCRAWRVVGSSGDCLPRRPGRRATGHCSRRREMGRRRPAADIACLELGMNDKSGMISGDGAGRGEEVHLTRARSISISRALMGG
jgi:hypothetical protein